MRQTMPEDRTIMRDREADEARLSELRKPIRRHYGIPKSAGAAANIAHHKGG